LVVGVSGDVPLRQLRPWPFQGDITDLNEFKNPEVAKKYICPDEVQLE
jgi:hypothetical protein